MKIYKQILNEDTEKDVNMDSLNNNDDFNELSAKDQNELKDILNDDSDSSNNTKQKLSNINKEVLNLNKFLEDAANKGLTIYDSEENLYDILDHLYSVNNINSSFDSSDDNIYGEYDDFDPSEIENDDYDYGDDFDPEDDYEYDDDGNKHIIKDEGQYLNLLCVGKGGSGKTSIIRKWARSRKLNLMGLVGSEIRADDLVGIPFHVEYKDENGKVIHKVQNLTNNRFEVLNMPGQSVLFIDEINRSFAKDRASLLKLIQEHRIPDSNSKTGDTYLKNLLFVVAAMNPGGNGTYEGADLLDDAMITRFAIYDWDSNPKVTLEWYAGICRRRLERLAEKRKHGQISAEAYKLGVAIIKGRRNIMTTLLSNDEFRFSTSEEEAKAHRKQIGVLNSRTLTSAVEASDGTVNGKILGSRQGFMPWFKRFCGSHQEVQKDENGVPMQDEDGKEITTDDDTTLLVSTILADVEDAEDEANGAFTDIYTKFEKYCRRNGIRL